MANDFTIPGASVGDEPGSRSAPSSNAEANEEAKRQAEALQARGAAVLASPDEVDAHLDVLAGADAPAEAASQAAAPQSSETQESPDGEEAAPPEAPEGQDRNEEDEQSDETPPEQLTPEEAALRAAALEAANAPKEEGGMFASLAKGFAAVSGYVTKAFDWIKEKVQALFGKLGWKKKEKAEEGDVAEKEKIRRGPRYASGDDIAALAKDIADGNAPDVELPPDNQSCWGWVESVYAAAGFDLNSTPRLYENLEGEGDAFTDFDGLKPGDHVIFHNGNGDDDYGNHSGIFIRWLNKDKRRAEVANYSGGADGEVKIDEIDFNQDEIRRVRQPEQKELAQDHFEDAEMLDPSAPVFTVPLGTSLSISSPYAMRDLYHKGNWRFHPAVDIPVPWSQEGAPIISTLDGCKVVRSGTQDSGGNFVYLQLPTGEEVGYMHLQEPAPPAGTEINRGDVIGLIGTTGNSSGPHIHYTVLVGGDDVNPAPYLSAALATEAESDRVVREAEFDAWQNSPAVESEDDLPPVPLTED